jgi:enterochelin esterase-like enzyme
MDTKDVPRGAAAQITYFSKSLDRFRRMHIYTPPGYETNQEKYPILYLVHGFNDNDNSWTSVGRAGIILDNMIAAGKVKPMVVVMPALHTRIEDTLGGGARRGGPGGVPGVRNEFDEDFLKDIMPYAESHYRVYADRDHRAMAGLSMGGMATRRITLSNLDRFSHIGILSGGSIAPADITDMASFKQNVKLVFVSYGSRENGAAAKANVETLKQAGVNSVWYESADTQHDWVTWRRSLIQFAPLLFQN